MQNSIWERIESRQAINYEDIEKYIYLDDYDNLNNVEHFHEKYNPALVKYSFEVEEYTDENDYNEVFFQAYLDDDISSKEYFYYENKYIDFLSYLSKLSKCYAYCDFDVPLDENAPFAESKDVTFDSCVLSSLSNSLSEVKNENIFKQLSYVSAREIGYVLFLFVDIRAVIISSGLHGLLLTEKDIDREVKYKISEILKISKIG